MLTLLPMLPRTPSVKTGEHDFDPIETNIYSLLMFRKDLFDIVIFFARKPSFFIDRRPFWKLEAEKEVKCADKLVTDISVGSATLTFGSAQVESFTGWDELDTNNFYSQASRKIIEMVLKSFFQGNWHDLNEFFEYATEWEPSASLYFGDNILQVQ